MNDPKRWKLLWASGLVGLVLFFCGLKLASFCRLINDEVYSQVNSVTTVGYGTILLGRVTGEGNNAPLFYLLQKGLCGLGRFQTPEAWLAGERFSTDPYAMIFLRLNPVFFMSLAGAALFYFFLRQYSWGWGTLAVVVFLSSGNVWMHTVQARHYALWLGLTMIQSLLFLALLQKSKPQTVQEECSVNCLWGWLGLVHVLLALTVILSLGQIAVVSLLLWIFKDKKWLRFFPLVVLPAILCGFYFLQVKHFQHDVPPQWPQVIRSSFPVEQLAILLVFGLGMGINFFRNKDNPSDSFSDRSVKIYFLFAILILAAAFILMGLFQWRAPVLPSGHKVSSNYFMFLTPAGIIGTVLFSVSLWRGLRNHPWLRANGAIALAGLIVLMYLHNYPLWVFGEILKERFGL